THRYATSTLVPYTTLFRSFVQGVAELCKKLGILLVADEIQTGFGRTGKYFAMEHFGVEPDLITISKSMAAGVPISGVIGRKEIRSEEHTSELQSRFDLVCR